MTDAPERIWIDTVRWSTGGNLVAGADTQRKGSAEYIRADLVPQWQPIETAPRDGSWFIIWAHGKPEVGKFDPFTGDKYEHVEGDMYRKTDVVLYEWRGFNNFHAATHWTPFPPPPEGEA